MKTSNIHSSIPNVPSDGLTSSEGAFDHVRNDGIQQAACDYLNMGFSVMPVNHDKRPVSAWKRYQTTKMMPSSVSYLFDEIPAIAIICGKVSGIEIIDIDSKNDKSGT